MDENGFPLVNRGGLLKIHACEIPPGAKLSRTTKRFVRFQSKVCKLWNSGKYDDVLFSVLYTKTSNQIRARATDRFKIWLYQVTVKAYLMQHRHGDALTFISNLQGDNIQEESDFIKASILCLQGDVFLDRYYNDTCMAVGYYKLAAEILPEDPDVVYGLANAYFFNKEYASALKIYEKAKKLRSPGADEQFKRIVCCQNVNDEKKANKLIKRFLKSDIDPKDQNDPRNMMPGFGDEAITEGFMYGMMKNMFKVMTKTWDEDFCDSMAWDMLQCFDDDRNIDTEKFLAFAETMDDSYEQKARAANMPRYECAFPDCKNWSRRKSQCDDAESDDTLHNTVNAEGMKLCTGCRNVYYCGKECQRKHWKIHKKVCRATQAKSSPV